MENPVSNVDPDQKPHYVASDLGLDCMPMTLLRISILFLMENPVSKQ